MNGPPREALRGGRLRFDGWIAGLGTASGTRIVLGHWPRSPFGPFSDVMLERPDGERLLLAPTPRTADFVGGTYVFDTVRVVPVGVRVSDGTWSVTAGPLDLRFTTGRRRPLGLLLCAVPGVLARQPAWCTLLSGPARVLLPGVRTRGSARAGRREWYGARDLRTIRTVSGVFEGEDLGAAAPVVPPVRFGFGSVPRRPSLTRVTTTVAAGQADGFLSRGADRRQPSGVRRQASGVSSWSRGDRLLLYPGGIVDARDSEGQRFGRERFVDFVVRHHSGRRTLHETLRRLMHAVLDDHSDRPEDDATVVLTERRAGHPDRLVP